MSEYLSTLCFTFGFPLVCFLADTLPRIRVRRVDSGISIYLDRTAYGMWYRSPTK